MNKLKIKEDIPREYEYRFDDPVMKKYRLSKFIRQVKLFYTDPQNVKEFEEWKKQRAAGGIHGIC